MSYENGGAWRRAVCNEVQLVLDSEASSFALPIDGEDFFEGPPEVVRALQAIVPPPEWIRTGLIINRGARAPSIANWTELFDADAVRKTPFYNDVVRPYRLLAPVVMMEGIAEGQFPATLTIYYANEREAAAHAERRKQMLELLLPAFRAGVKAYLTFGCHRSPFEQLIQRGTTGLILVDVDGKALHENKFLAELQANEPEYERIRTALGRVARATRCFAAGSSRSELPFRTSADVRTALGTYRLSGTCWPGTIPASLVLIERTTCQPMTPSQLASRFKLTKREIEVAQLVRDGLSTRDIASVLGVSINTARRHVESVLLKLNVHSRAAAVSRLAGVMRVLA
jgi:DNA-binding NarL/FixJ family response regulator